MQSLFLETSQVYLCYDSDGQSYIAFDYYGETIGTSAITSDNATSPDGNWDDATDSVVLARIPLLHFP